VNRRPETDVAAEQSLTRRRVPAPATPAVDPRERLRLLCDPGSIRYLRTGVRSERINGDGRRGDGVVAAVAKVGARPIVCYAQDVTFAGGSVGSCHADSVVELHRLAQRTRVPLVAFLESGGARLQEGVHALAGYGRIFRETVAAARVVPQISVICGACAGGGSYAPALTDFVVMQASSRMFLTGPRVVRLAVGERADAEELGGPRIHSRNGVCDLVVRSPLEAAAAVHRLLSYLPSSIGDEPPRARTLGPSSDDPAAVMPREARRIYDVRELLRGVIDTGSLLELAPRWAPNLVTGFGRIAGRAIGIVASQPRYLGGLLDSRSSLKGARFVGLCDRFRVPLLVVVDTPGFMPGRKAEKRGVIRHGADLVRAFAGATVPRVTLVTRKAYGGAYIAMNCKDLGSDLVFAWPGAEIGIMAAAQAAAVVGHDGFGGALDSDDATEAYHLRHLSAARAAEGGFVDEVIAPADTRAQLEWAFELLARAPR
jgi:acetyl-CoA carboxylase carboxyltransferase component